MIRALVVERNKLVARRIARVWTCAGMEVTCLEDTAGLPAALAGADVVAADAFDGDAVLAALRSQPSLRAVLWTPEPLERALRFTVDPRLSSVLGRAGFDASPRDWELLLVARRMLRPRDPIPFGAFVSWGFTGFKEQVRDTPGRDQMVANVQGFLGQAGLPKRVGEMFGELAHELIMNALYDAPADPSGRARHAHDRKAPVQLPEHEAATIRLGCDGARLALQVVDPFGRLQRKHVFEGLARGLKGQMEQAGGGAGLGMAVCVGATVGMVFDVVPGHKTEVTGVFDLDLNLREFKTQAKSIHWFEGS